MQENIFANGIPKELVSDKGPEFTSHHFKTFAKSWNYKHQTVSPHYQQSNGLVERSIQTVKRTLKGAKYYQQNEYLALLYLNSQRKEKGISPAQKLFNSQFCTNLPLVKLLLPQNSFVTETPRPRKTTHSLPNISQRNTVRIRTDKQNLCDKKGINIKKSNRPRSYDVLNENENVMVRNRKHLITTNEKSIEKFSYSNIIPTTTKPTKRMAPPQTTNLLKLVTSSTTINPLKTIGHNETRLGRVLKKNKQVCGTVLTYLDWRF